MTVVDPSRLMSTVAAKPSVRSVVKAGTVPAASENMLKAKVLPEVDTPSGEFTAGPYNLTSKYISRPYVNP